MKGFTLIETLFAILILTLAVTGPLTIAARGLNAALIAKDQTTAFYLAQDAIEYVRYARDSNRLADTNWLAGSGGSSPTNLTPCVAPNTCYLDSTNNAPAVPTVCSATGADCSSFPLYYNSTNGWYTYNTSGATRSPFTRTIQISTPPGSAPGEVLASTTVAWTDVGGVRRSVNVHESIFNWQ